MKRADRSTPSNDNNIRHPHPKPSEPVSPHEWKQRYLAARATVKEKEEQLQQVSTDLETTQQHFEVVQHAVVSWKSKAQESYDLYVTEQKRYQNTLILYNQEHNRVVSLMAQYDEVDTERSKYLKLYEDALSLYESTLSELKVKRSELKVERRSKSAIKGWETRRKKENEQIKEQIAQLAILLRDSLERKEEAIINLEMMANRMDRIQMLIGSIDKPIEGQVNLLVKFRRIWASIKEILAE